MAKPRLSSLTTGQREVYDILLRFGPLPDHALIPLAQHVVKSAQSSSGIRTRRNELEGLGFVRATGETHITRSGRKAFEFKAVR